MSFMIMDGKIFLCSSCNKRVTVKYEGEPFEVMIGEFELISQRYLRKKYGHPDCHPEHGYYFFEEGLCAKCYATKVSWWDKNPLKKISGAFSFLVIRKAMLKKIEHYRHEIQQKILAIMPGILRKIAAKITPSDIDKILEEKFDPAFGDKHATPGKRQRLIKSFLQQHGHKFFAFFISEFIKNAEVAALCREYDLKTKTMRDKVQKIPHFMEGSYFSKRTDKIEIIWPFFSGSFIKKPVPGTHKEKFFFERRFSDYGLIDEIEINARQLISEELLSKLIYKILELEYF